MANLCDFAIKIKGDIHSIDNFLSEINADARIVDDKIKRTLKANYQHSSCPWFMRAVVPHDKGQSLRGILEAHVSEITIHQDEWNTNDKRIYTPGVCEATINGYCKWSVNYSMLTSIEGRENTPETIQSLSKKYSVDVEIFSDEPGMCFQEHYIIKDGCEVVSETRDTEVYLIGDDDTRADAEENYNVDFTEEEWQIGRDLGMITRGGFVQEFTI